jgi:hemolysin III
MGWMVIFIGQPIIQGLNAEGLTWLIIGGGGYSLGVIFFLWNKLPYNHAIWHVFVLAGTASHFLAVWTALGT